jgi:PKD repeat protein
MWRRLTGVVAALALLVAVAGIGTRAAGAATPPVANAGGPYYAAVGLPIQLNGASSTGTNLGFFWTFDDGTTATGVAVTRSFSTAGTHTATLRVTDSTGLSSTATATVTVSTTASGSTGYLYTGVYGTPYYYGAAYPYGYLGAYYGGYYGLGYYGYLGTYCGVTAVYISGLTCSTGPVVSPYYYPALNVRLGIVR